jgi:imidazole glycerol-phosphate synthase subunit HisF
MTLLRRIIVCLDVAGDRVVKGVRFEGLRDVGDPIECAMRYEAAGADEIVFLDVAATLEQRGTMLDVVQRTAERLFIPLTVGGGIRSVANAAAVLRAGADKIAVNSAAVARPRLISELSAQFGAQCVVASIDSAKVDHAWHVRVRGGSTATALDVVEWARLCAELGAGEILLTSIDRDGTRGGYDLELTSAVSNTVKVPVIASGGAGTSAHVVDALARTGASAALVAGIVHDRVVTVVEIKRALSEACIPVRAA